MNVDDLKRLVTLVALAVGFIALGALVLGAGTLQQRISAGADPAAAFTEVPTGVPALDGIVVWAPDAVLQEREVEPATRRAVEAAWTRAWQARQRASAGDSSLLDTWFSGPALDQALTLVSPSGPPVGIRLGRHRLRITFYSDDGSVIGLSADPVRIYRTITTEAGLWVLGTDESYDVVLLLEDGNWRIRQWERTGVVPVESTLTTT
jgi:hypothetical protein